GMIDGCWVLRPVQWAVHHIVAFGTVFSANVLHDTDIASLDDDLRSVVIAVQNGTEVRTGCVAGELGRVVRRASQENRRRFRASWHEDDRVKFDSVAHRDHDVAPGVVETAGGRLQFIGSFAWQLLIGFLLLRSLTPGLCSLRKRRWS